MKRFEGFDRRIAGTRQNSPTMMENENKNVKIKYDGSNVTIEAAFLLSPRCLVTTKKAAVALKMILKLFVLTICLEKDVSCGICYF